MNGAIVCVAVLILVIIWSIDRYIPMRDPKCKQKTLVDRYPFKGGDLILTCGRSLILSVFGDSTWHHVATVYECPDSGAKYVWEIRMPPQLDLLSKVTSVSVYRASRLVPIKRYFEKLKRNERICVRPINKAVDPERFRCLVQTKWDTTFAMDFLILGGNRFFENFFTIPVSNRKTHNSRYCGEFIAETMQALGVFDFSNWPHTPTQTIPKDYGEETEYLPVKKEYWFGPEILLKRPIRSRKWKSIDLDDLILDAS